MHCARWRSTCTLSVPMHMPRRAALNSSSAALPLPRVLHQTGPRPSLTVVKGRHSPLLPGSAAGPPSSARPLGAAPAPPRRGADTTAPTAACSCACEAATAARPACTAASSAASSGAAAAPELGARAAAACAPGSACRKPLAAGARRKLPAAGAPPGKDRVRDCGAAAGAVPLNTAGEPGVRRFQGDNHRGMGVRPVGGCQQRDSHRPEDPATRQARRGAGPGRASARPRARSCSSAGRPCARAGATLRRRHPTPRTHVARGFTVRGAPAPEAPPARLARARGRAPARRRRQRAPTPRRRRRRPGGGP